MCDIAYISHKILFKESLLLLFTASCPKFFRDCESRCQMKSGQNEEKHFGRLTIIYEEEMKNTKARVPKEFGKYLDAYIWLRGGPKFGTRVLNLVGDTVPYCFIVNGDICASKLESKYRKSKDSKKQQMVGQDKAKMMIKEKS